MLEVTADPGSGVEMLPQPTLSEKRDSVGVEVAVLTDDLVLTMDQQQVLAR